jgi:hypothetical protein
MKLRISLRRAVWHNQYLPTLRPKFFDFGWRVISALHKNKLSNTHITRSFRLSNDDYLTEQLQKLPVYFTLQSLTACYPVLSKITLIMSRYKPLWSWQITLHAGQTCIMKDIIDFTISNSFLFCRVSLMGSDVVN